MYINRSNSNRNSDRRSFRGSSSRSSSSRYSRSRKSPKHDISKFIQKAEPIKDSIPYVSTHKFVDFPFCKELQENISSKGYLTPTPIQDQAINSLLEGNDLVGIANTGTGKTAAFLLPLIDLINKDKINQKALIIAPTRELAIQIDNELKSFSKGMGIYSALCIGGTSVYRQISDLKRKYNFVIGTPGRIKDMYLRRHLNLTKFNKVVLDEVDRMLDMGFINDIRSLISAVPKERQTIFFSATMDKEVEPLMAEFLNKPIKISVVVAQTSKNIDQNVVKYTNLEEKIDVLHNLLSTTKFEKMLIFDKTKRGVESLYKILSRKGFKVTSIHGDKKQSHRLAAIKQFKSGGANILLATDIAARGLDMDDITHVVNYDIPETYDTYIHRIGRTGRANKSGIALTFIQQSGSSSFRNREDSPNNSENPRFKRDLNLKREYKPFSENSSLEKFPKKSFIDSKINSAQNLKPSGNKLSNNGSAKLYI
jgi:ATP-dependent RNA helicase RhlE